MAEALHAITLLISAPLMHELERLPVETMAHVAPMLCPLEVSPFDFAASGVTDRTGCAIRLADGSLEGGLTRRAAGEATSRRIRINSSPRCTLSIGFEAFAHELRCRN